MKGSLISRPLACLDVVQRQGCRRDLMHDMGDGSWRSTNALASIDAEVEMLSGIVRSARSRRSAICRLFYGAERNDLETADLAGVQGRADLFRGSAEDRK